MKTNVARALSIFHLNGTVYKYTVPISAGDVYQIKVENRAGHNEGSWPFSYWVQDSNHYSGNLFLKRTPDYLSQLMKVGAVLVILGSLLIPSVFLAEYKARQRASLLYECPRCQKQVKVGLSTCPYCRIDLTRYWIKCKYCGKLYDSHLGKCSKCGAEA